MRWWRDCRRRRSSCLPACPERGISGLFSYMRQKPGFYREVVTLAFPIVLQNMVTTLLSMADTFMVGMLGELPLAAVTLANIPLNMVNFFIFGVQSGITVLISQYWGRQDRQAINRIMGVGVWFSVSVSLTVALILLFRPVGFLSLFGNNRAIVELAAEYGRIAGFSWVLNGVTMIYVATYRSMERPKLGMYILMSSMLCNTFLNWVLIFGNLGAPALGVKGAAIATLIARMLEWVMIGAHMKLGRYFKVELKYILAPGRKMLRQFIRYGTPVVANEAFWGIGTGLYPTIMGHMAGSQEILAAYTIVGNVNTLCMVAIFGLASTAAILIGREIGAGNKDQVYNVGLTMNALSIGVGILMGAVLLVFAYVLGPGLVFPFFHLSPGAGAIATMMLATQGFIAPLRDFNTTNIVGVLRGGGDVTAATAIDLSALWMLAIPWAAVCGLVLHTAVFWVYLAIAVEQVSKFFCGVWRLRSGKWVHDITRAGTGE